MSRCGLCNRRLHDRESIEVGFGPTCWARLSAQARARDGTGPPHAPPPGPVAPPSTVPPAPSGAVAAPAADGPPAEADARAAARRPGQRASPALAGLGWLMVLGALLVLVEYWPWVVLGLTGLGVLAALGMLLEWVGARRARPAPPRRP